MGFKTKFSDNVGNMIGTCTFGSPYKGFIFIRYVYVILHYSMDLMVCLYRCLNHADITSTITLSIYPFPNFVSKSALTASLQYKTPVLISNRKNSFVHVCSLISK